MDLNRKEVIVKTQEKCSGEDQNGLPVPEKVNVYGTINGIKIGTIWESRIECSAAGVHKPLDADIHVGSDGVYSLLLCGESKYNIDYGECITSTVNIEKNKSYLKNEINVQENQRLGLSKNHDTGNPIRVIRSADLKSPYASDRGFRYDGLYIVRKLYRVISDDGQYISFRFALKRRENQTVAPWKKHLTCEIPLETSAVKKLKDSSIKLQEKSPTSNVSYASVCERESARDSLHQSNVIHSCLKKTCNPQKKYVTFGDNLNECDTKKSFKEYLVEMSKKLDNKVCKLTRNRLVNRPSMDLLNKTGKSGTKRSSTISSSSVSVQSEKMEKAQSSHIYMEEKCSDTMSSSAGNCLKTSSNNSDLQQHIQDSKIKYYENNKITTVDELFNVEETRTDMVQRQEAEEKMNAFIENSSSNSKVEKVHRECNSEEKNVGGEIVNDDSTVEIRNCANEVELHQLKDTSKHLSVMVRESEELSQETNDNGDSMQKPKEESNHIVKSVPSCSVNAGVVVPHSSKQDSLEINSKIESNTTASSKSRIVGALPTSSSGARETKFIGLQSSSSQNCIIKPINMSDSSSSGCDFGKSVNSLCLQLSKLESKQCKSGTRSRISANETRFGLQQKQDLEKSSDLLKDIKANKHKTIPEVKSVSRKRKYTEKLVDSKIASSNAHGSKRSVQLLNKMDCNSFSRLKASKNCLSHIREHENKVSHDINTFKENNSDEKSNLHSDKDSSKISVNEPLMLNSEKLLPVVSLTKISNEHVRKFCNYKKSVNSKEPSRKRKCTFRDMKEKMGLRECHVQLTRLRLPPLNMIRDREMDSWCGWQVHSDSLQSACNVEVLTISDGDTQTQTLIWGSDDDQSCDSDEPWKGWDVITAYTNIDDSEEESGWFKGW